MAFPHATDHLVYATSDLAASVVELEELLGVRASPGGRHPGVGTCNYLLSLGEAVYLEVIGPDSEQQAPRQPRPFGIDWLECARLVTWAIRETDLESRIASAREQGYDPGDALPMSRQSPQGLLEWRLAKRQFGRQASAGEGLVPFLIDWGKTPHPAAAGAPGCSLLELRAEHPEPESLRRLLAIFDLSLPVAKAPRAALIAQLETPKGLVELR